MDFKKLLAISILVIAVAAASAGWCAPTESGTPIVNTATISAGNATSESASATVVVEPIYGVALGSETADRSATAGGYATYTFSFTNESNDPVSDTLNILVDQQQFGSTAGTNASWSVEIDDASTFSSGLNWTNSGTAKAETAGDYVTLLLGPGAAISYTIRVTSASDAQDNATMSMPIYVYTESDPAGTYTGYNGTDYGGYAWATRTVGTLMSGAAITTTIQGALLSLTKSLEIDSPSEYVSLGGAADAPVPGAKITYTISYNNWGMSNALGVTIIDTYPAQTTYLANSISGTPSVSCSIDEGTRTVTCTLGDVAAGQSGTIEYSVTID